jgi:hypothetical protein
VALLEDGEARLRGVGFRRWILHSNAGVSAAVLAL